MVIGDFVIKQMVPKFVFVRQSSIEQSEITKQIVHWSKCRLGCHGGYVNYNAATK